MSDPNASDNNAMPDHDLPDQRQPEITRPIIIGFKGITTATTQIGYTIEACDALPLGPLLVSLTSGTQTAPSTPDPTKIAVSPTITVPSGWVHNPLSYTVTNPVTHDVVIPATSISIPSTTITPQCVENIKGGHHHHHHHHEGHEHHEEHKP